MNMIQQDNPITLITSSQNREISTILTNPKSNTESIPFCGTNRVIGFRRTNPKILPEINKMPFFDRIPYLIVKPVLNFLDNKKEFVNSELKKTFGENISLTYEDFITQITNTSKISKENDITFIIIAAHGNGKKINPYLRLEDTKLEYETLFDMLDEINGIKVLFILSCGSGAIKYILENREKKEDYWAITSSYKTKISNDLICRKPWKMLDCIGSTLEEQFNNFKNKKIRFLCQKATYIKGRNIHL
ncbi:hypothetical protein KO317_01985 [Candidatus Micrarchaeota archaeon]|nr:hypothetical protein [Candidatus Micrarchaeota archaeon]